MNEKEQAALGDIELIRRVLARSTFDSEAAYPFFAALTVILGLLAACGVCGAVLTLTWRNRASGTAALNIIVGALTLTLLPAWLLSRKRARGGGSLFLMLLDVWGVFILVYAVAAALFSFVLPAFFAPFGGETSFYASGALISFANLIFPSLPLLISGILADSRPLRRAGVACLLLSALSASSYFGAFGDALWALYAIGVAARLLPFFAMLVFCRSVRTGKYGA